MAKNSSIHRRRLEGANKALFMSQDKENIKENCAMQVYSFLERKQIHSF